jgi:hypothetical protein
MLGHGQAMAPTNPKKTFKKIIKTAKIQSRG